MRVLYIVAAGVTTYFVALSFGASTGQAFGLQMLVGLALILLTIDWTD